MRIHKLNLTPKEKAEIADLRLRMAAPSLLSVCETMYGWIDAFREDESTGEGQEAKMILETAEAAMRKAGSFNPWKPYDEEEDDR